MFRRVLPAVGLFFLSPLVAEFLLGNLSITAIGAAFFLAPLYGGGALLIREVARRTGRRWPSIVLLAIAYGVLEEGITTQSLFNPNYVGLRLLDYGHVDALGMGIPWTVGVITINTVWSICVPILIVEVLVGPERRTKPWLGRVGLTVTAVLFAVGVFLTTFFQLNSDPFRASVGQLAGTVVAILLLVAVAFLVARRAPSPVARNAPNPWLVFAGALVVGAVYESLDLDSPIPAWLEVTIVLVLLAVVAVTIRTLARREGWGVAHHFALGAAMLITYAWHGFPQPSLQNGNTAVDLVGNAVFAAGALVLIAFGARRVRHEAEHRGEHVALGHDHSGGAVRTGREG